MNKNRVQWGWAAGLIFSTTLAAAGNATLQNTFTFYSDNTEFFEPFRLRETILGERVISYLALAAGDQTALRVGLSADHRDARNSETSVQPVLSFIHHAGELESVMGAILPVRRHGLLEPMEVTNLELTRPVEYGTQLILENDTLRTDVFLNWQTLLTPSSREIFDYGCSTRFTCFPGVELGAQAHCYHVGGALYGGVVRNNFAGGLGLLLKSRLPLLGESSLTAFGFGSNDTGRPGYPGPVNGSGFYARASLSPIDRWEVFGIAWFGKDYLSEEGDSNYNSYGYDGVFYKSDRNYEEVGIRYSAVFDPGVTFNFEIRSHWIEDAWAHSFRIVAQVPFDVEIKNLNPTPRLQDTKKDKTDETPE